MSMTKAQLATAVLKRLAVIGAGETADADDRGLVETVIDEVHPELRKLGLAPFLTSAIPDWAVRGMVKIIAAEVGPEFGRVDPMYNDHERSVGEKALAKQVAHKPRGRQTKARYF